MADADAQRHGKRLQLAGGSEGIRAHLRAREADAQGVDRVRGLGVYYLVINPAGKKKIARRFRLRLVSGHCPAAKK
jgi:hypothetical protein